MKPLFYIFLSFSLFVSCQPNTTAVEEDQTNDTKTQVTDETATATSPKQGVVKGGIYIEKLTDYSPQFIAGIQNAAESIPVVSMLGDRLVTEGGDTIRFPNTPTIGEEFLFSGGEEGEEVELKVERVNQSTIRYSLIINLAAGGTYEMKGLADLAPLFFLGAESDEDEKTGLSYFASEYHDPSSECNNSIRIGQAEDESIQLAKVIMDCFDLPMGVDESPTLRTK